MSELGGSESFSPSEESNGVSEAAREQAAQRFAASQQAAAQQQKEERKAKKRDDNVAQVILQFLTDTQKTHLATLIARLIARDCPSTFVLAVLSVINDKCSAAVEDFLRERGLDPSSAGEIDRSVIPANAALSDEANGRLAAWIMCMELTMRAEHEKVLTSLIVDQHNIDGTILQLSTFVLQEFLASHDKNVAFENLQNVSGGILQSLFRPYMHAHAERLLAEAEERRKKEEEEDD